MLIKRNIMPRFRRGECNEPAVPNTPQVSVKRQKKALFSGLWLSGEINGYIEQIDRDAEEMYSQLVKQLAESEGVTEQLKADDQMDWIQRMNNIHNRAEEIVYKEMIMR